MDFTQYLDPKLSPSVRARQDTERRIVDEIAKALIQAGYIIRVHDGEDWATKRTSDPVTIQKAIMQTDEDAFIVYKAESKSPFGRVDFVYGNDGYDVTSDWTMGLDEIIQPIVSKFN
jgi:hypothetical protein